MTQHFIAGAWCDASSGDTIPVIDPSTGAAYAAIASGNEVDIDRAVRAARAARDGDWGQTNPMERGRLLMRMAQTILAHKDELVQIEARDTGKPLRQAVADITAVARYFEFYGGAADKFHGETIPYLNGYAVSVVHEPHGVTGHIIPWNYPAQMFGRTLAPALAVGNAAVLKPAEDACMTPLRLAELATEAGFPPGVINVVTGYGATAGAALSAHPDIDFISFTGSPEAGVLVQRAAAANYTPCVMELGGKSPHIIFEDADLDAALPLVVGAILQNGGQTCSAGSRVLIHESLHQRFVEALRARFAAVRAGTPEMDLDCGPLISHKQQQRVERFLQHAAEHNIPVLAQGQIAAGCAESGFFVRPTVFGPVPEDDLLAREEVFGPVLAVLPFASEAEAIRIANATDYGLIAAVWTRDGARQHRVTRQLRCGQVFINCYGAAGGVELPFGGVKKSGYGREKGFSALEEFCITKTVVNHYG